MALRKEREKGGENFLKGKRGISVEERKKDSENTSLPLNLLKERKNFLKKRQTTETNNTLCINISVITKSLKRM